MRISGENRPWETCGGFVAAAVVAAVVTAGVGLYTSKKASGEAKKNRQESARASAAARRQQNQSLDAQRAITNRDRVEADRRETELSGQLASQRRAVVARRGSRGQLAFSGSNTGLKQTFGG